MLASGSLQSYGGAIAAVGEAETAFGHRDALLEFVAVAAWTDPAQDQARMAAARIPPGHAGAAGGAEGRYDPGNGFHLNHNIRPSSA